MNSPRAIVRDVPATFDRAIVRGRSPAPDVARARRQHEAYRAALTGGGYDVTVVAADDDHPDCPFIEDVAVVLEHIAVATRPGAPSRRGEVGPVARVLAEMRVVRSIEPPGTLDGGDVLVVERTIYAGRSSRTNDAGIAQLRLVAAEGGYETIAVDVSSVLHLKSGVGILEEETLLVAPEAVDTGAFRRMRLIEKAPEEVDLASTLRLLDGTVLVAASAPRTTARLAAAGFDVAPIDISEFQAADGGLTCLSILVNR